MRRAATIDRPEPVWRRLLWFAALWVGSVLALAIVAMILRTVLEAA